MLIIIVSRSKAGQYFVSSSCMFLKKNNLLKTWLNPVLKLIIFKGTGLWCSKILTLSLRDTIANFSRLHCLAIPRRDLSTKKTKPNIEK